MVDERNFLIKRISVSVFAMFACLLISVFVYFSISIVEKNRFNEINTLNNQIDLLTKEKEDLDLIKKNKTEISDNFVAPKYNAILSNFKIDYVNYILDKLDEKLKTNVETSVQDLDPSQYRDMVSSSKSHISKINLSFKYPADLMLIQVSKYLFDTLPGSFILDNITIQPGDNILELSLNGLWIYVSY